MSAAAMTSAVPKPAHVPDALVYDFDFRNDAAYVRDPHTRIQDLIAKAPPIFWTPHNGGHWLAISHAANFDASRDTETFSNSYMPPEQIAAFRASLPKDAPHIPMAIPIGLDPPDHTKYRMPLQGAFSPKTMNALKDDIRALAVSLIAPIAPNGRCEFMSEVAELMPVQVFLKMLGLPLERQDEYRELVRENLLSSSGTDMSKSVASVINIAASMRPTFIARRDNPQNDIISLLWQTKIDGQPLTLEDMENYGVLLFIAGLDTVMQGMGFAAHHLARHPELQRQLRAQPELIAEAVEEMLRRYTFTVPPRRVAKDTVFQGVEMKRNDRLFLFLPAADLDPKEFPNPGQFDLNREKKVHIAFNAGPHRCLGSHLARVELQILYEELLPRLPEFRLDPAKPIHYHGGHVVGVDSLHLVWDV